MKLIWNEIIPKLESKFSLPRNFNSDGGFAREAEVQQAMENGLGSCMYVCMYVCMYICMFFTYISQFTAHTEFKSVPFASPLNS